MQFIHVVVSNTHNKEQKGRTDGFRALTDGRTGRRTDGPELPTDTALCRKRGKFVHWTSGCGHLEPHRTLCMASPPPPKLALLPTKNMILNCSMSRFESLLLTICDFDFELIQLLCLCKGPSSSEAKWL